MEPPSLEPVDIDLLVSDLMREIRGIAERMGIDVAATNTSTAFVKANPEGLRHALVLLLTALLERTRRGGAIRISFHDLKGWVDLSVHASRCPLPPELLEAFSEPAWIDGRTGGGSGYRIFNDVKTVVQEMDVHIRLTGGNAAETTVAISLDRAAAPQVPRPRQPTWWTAAIRSVRASGTACPGSK
jgi:hypothetical protein